MSCRVETWRDEPSGIWATYRVSFAIFKGLTRVKRFNDVHSLFGYRNFVVFPWPVHLRCRPSNRWGLSAVTVLIVQPPVHRSTVAGPLQMWNCLPLEVTSAPRSLATFRARLETFRFTESYPNIRLIDLAVVLLLGQSKNQRMIDWLIDWPTALEEAV